MKKTIDITFKSIEDFRRRICKLWQDQKEDEIYNFIFLCDKVEKEWGKFSSIFQKDMVE